ncbi:MFS transporter [Vulcanisaeta distributa]|uniref:Major facilitator superfamily MFS_1 n=1 Tax=Vulcanisaeta distributa (strain DSM 14429 / JCM 11212 / NBRC 100878 / IC-017) TaxID=572478 RepID=E1QU90_VULDI|nr:MFS transporter [Vulcanisaeta distributa]ADN51084.1 major facilitator superfamily MFS_1 [Vulcanisaeta distributa DSM 14429]
MTNSDESGIKVVKTDLLARLDRLPFSPFHRKVILVLTAAYFLDGLESTLYGGVLAIVAKVFKITSLESTLGLVLFLIGAAIGAELFGVLADVLGRKRLFMTTILIYGLFTALSAASFNFISLTVFRFLTGVGIGGEYGAVNSAIQEFVPPRERGKWLGFVIGAGWDVGTVIASLISYFAISRLPISIGWRVAFLVGAILAVFVWVIRRSIPESPRWLLSKGRYNEAEGIVRQVEDLVKNQLGIKELPPVQPVDVVIASPRGWTVARKVFTLYPRRAVSAVLLNFSETWPYYTAFTLIPVFLSSLGVPSTIIPLYLVPVTAFGAVGAFVIPYLADKVGRRPMAVVSYAVGGLLGLLMAYLYYIKAIGLTGLIGLLALTYFFVYAAADILYVMIPEVFPTQLRAAAVGTAVSIGRLGGIIGAFVMPYIIVTFKPLPYAALIAFTLMAVIMIIGAIAGVLIGVEGKGKSLEELSTYR